MLDVKSLTTDLIRADQLRVLAGERVLVQGPSGSGKTHFLRALADLVPWQGHLVLDQQSSLDVSAPQWRQQVMLVAADSHWWHHRVSEHFHSPETAPLSHIGLSEAILSRDPQQLSSGEKQRLALLRALDRSPKVLLLDEPCANLDSDTTLLVEALLTDWCRHHQGHLIMTSHDPAQRERLADRHWRILDGEVTETGATTREWT
ncbi:ABC transporter ATP-binding protein [Marinobacter sp. SS21]|uniref:ABC transporter ATP-binding protein n=1 Tax=Marinobacter sp. SS21 TaxID=2979460 RepID=UPI00232ECBC5|nr:ATP-binding cassette domain-containing protein [Marinobacter sp. SS21]MDC0661473.1 ATP-binding cassette domain-containing protein [Marinobacter sp. SS21]